MSLPDIAERAEVRELQYRSYPLEDFELREDTDTGTLTFEGVASVVDHPYTVRDMWGEYTETMDRGAFDKTISDGSARFSLYVNHQKMNVPLATRGAGTASLWADPHLRVKADLDPVRPDVQIVASALRRGEMGEMSVGFMPVRDKWNKERSEVHRVEVAVREASIVEQGLNTGGTKAALRSFDAFLETITDVDMTDDEIRRAIEHFQSRLGIPEATETALDAPLGDDEAALRVLLQAEDDWAMRLRRKHALTV